MPGSIIDDECWRQMTAAERTEVVHNGRATLRQLAQGLLDGPDALSDACHHALAHTGTALEELPVEFGNGGSPGTSSHQRDSAEPPGNTDFVSAAAKQRSGLPKGFALRENRAGRTILLPENIYRLPDGREFVPFVPAESPGPTRHQYALLTLPQFEQSLRASVFVRSDGRVFDYRLDGADTQLDAFDTGYTIDDLERTGKYATPVRTGNDSDRVTLPRDY
jgi:hypothetical protein